VKTAGRVLLIGWDCADWNSIRQGARTAMKELESDCTLKDGASVHIRPIQPEDQQTLVEGFTRLSPLTVYQRFLSPLPELTPGMARHLSQVDYRRRLALIAETKTEPVGVVRYEPTDDPGLAELGLVIVDTWQNRGLGRILLREILHAAEGNGIHRFCGSVLAENRRMLRLLVSETHIEEWKTEGSVTTVVLTARRRTNFNLRGEF
jgi:RimJ/RimL family protein N-acetyltransferase